METSAELLYLEKEYDKDNAFGFKDDLERSEALQWLFFWHGELSHPKFIYASNREQVAELLIKACRTMGHISQPCDL